MNIYAKPGSWGEAQCAEALSQIATTVTTLSKQLDQLWNLSDTRLRLQFNERFGDAFEHVDQGMADKIEAFAAVLQKIADEEQQP